MEAFAVTTHDLPVNPLGGLASVIDVSVAVVADETSARRLASLLAHEGLMVAVETDAPRRLPDVCLHGPPHVAIVLWRSCGPEPAGALRYLRRQLARTRVIVVLTEPRRQDMRCAVDAGADAIVLETRLAVTLGVTVRAVCAGQACVPRELRRQFERPLLSARERQVLGLVATGFTNGEIADRLFLAESTVKGHLSSAFSKLGIHSRQEASALVRDPEARLGIGLVSVHGAAHTEGTTR
jgi:DNA-binding NarL/FixJ family response regulator